MPDAKRPLKVFLCHAHDDKSKARELYRYLKRRGLQPWLDAEDLLPGQAWQVEIPKALETSDAIIILLSQTSVDKEGYVQKEIKFALDKALEMPEGRIFIIPARLDACNVPRSLSGYHWVDLFEDGGHDRLMKSLRLRAVQLERVTLKSTKAEFKFDATRKSEPAKTAYKEFVPQNYPAPPGITGNPDASHPITNLNSNGVLKTIVFGKDNAEQIQSSYQQEATQTEISTASKVEESEKPKPALPIEPKEPEKPSRKLKPEYIVAIIGAAATLLAALIGILPQIFKPVMPTTTNTPTITATFTQSPAATFTNLSPSETPTPSITPSTSFTPTSTPLPIEIVDAKGVTMRLVPAGKFSMGSDAENDESPVHDVFLDAYYIDIYEVTNDLYRLCVNHPEAGCNLPQNIVRYNDPQYKNYPVVFVTWNMAKTYCEWRDVRFADRSRVGESCSW